MNLWEHRKQLKISHKKQINNKRHSFEKVDMNFFQEKGGTKNEPLGAEKTIENIT